jgi:hypothetical protein
MGTNILKIIQQLLALFVIASGNFVVVAQTGNIYYVDNGHAQASDSNPGTESEPWLTIRHAAGVVAAGDMVVVKAGTYNERVNIGSGHGGTANNKVTFKSEPRRSAVMEGFQLNSNYIRIEGFDISTQQHGWLGGGIWISANNLEIIDNYFHDIPGRAVNSNHNGIWQNITISNNYVYRVNSGFNIHANGGLVENNEIERLIHANYDADYMRFFGENIILRGNFMHGTIQEEIGGSHTDAFQTFDNNGEYVHHCVIEGNFITDFYHQGFMGEADYYSNSYDITFRNNVFEGATSWGIAAVDNIKDVKIYNNLFINMGTHAVGIRRGASGEVYNNIFYNAGTNYWADDNSTLNGSGYNIINRPNRPNYSVSTDMVGVDPLLIDPANLLGPDGVPFTSDDGFRLQSNSPAIDAATDLSSSGFNNDIIGTSRPQGSAWDIGVYEYITGGTPQPGAPSGLKVK